MLTKWRFGLKSWAGETECRSWEVTQKEKIVGRRSTLKHRIEEAGRLMEFFVRFGIALWSLGSLFFFLWLLAITGAAISEARAITASWGSFQGPFVDFFLPKAFLLAV